MQNIRGANGAVIATIVQSGAQFTNVYDAQGSPIGYSSANGTFDARGALVSPNPDQYGLLIPRDSD
jgi:hypothetical protein